MIETPKSQSVTEGGQPDGWSPTPGFRVEMQPGTGQTRVTVQVPADQLQAVHLALVGVLATPLSVLYRQVVDRLDPQPEGTPPRDFVALELDTQRVVEALEQAAGLVYHDARCEVWVRGGLDEQLVLDADGIVYCYPDDPAFRDVLTEQGLQDAEFETLFEREGYVKHWYHAENDAAEEAFKTALGLAEVPPQG